MRFLIKYKLLKGTEKEWLNYSFGKTNKNIKLQRANKLLYEIW